MFTTPTQLRPLSQCQQIVKRGQVAAVVFFMGRGLTLIWIIQGRIDGRGPRKSRIRDSGPNPSPESHGLSVLTQTLRSQRQFNSTEIGVKGPWPICWGMLRLKSQKLNTHVHARIHTDTQTRTHRHRHRHTYTHTHTHSHTHTHIHTACVPLSAITLCGAVEIFHNWVSPYGDWTPRILPCIMWSISGWQRYRQGDSVLHCL